MTTYEAIKYLSNKNDIKCVEIVELLECLSSYIDTLETASNKLMCTLSMRNDELKELKANQPIKCKDCKNCEIKKRVGNGITEPPYINNLRCNLFSLEPMQEDDFCSYAERKEVEVDE